MDLKLRIAKFGSQLSHTNAHQHPTLRQVTPAQLLVLLSYSYTTCGNKSTIIKSSEFESNNVWGLHSSVLFPFPVIRYAGVEQQYGAATSGINGAMPRGSSCPSDHYHRVCTLNNPYTTSSAPVSPRLMTTTLCTFPNLFGYNPKGISSFVFD